MALVNSTISRAAGNGYMAVQVVNAIVDEKRGVTATLNSPELNAAAALSSGVTLGNVNVTLTSLRQALIQDFTTNYTVSRYDTWASPLVVTSDGLPTGMVTALRTSAQGILSEVVRVIPEMHAVSGNIAATPRTFSYGTQLAGQEGRATYSLFGANAGNHNGADGAPLNDRGWIITLNNSREFTFPAVIGTWQSTNLGPVTESAVLDNNSLCRSYTRAMNGQNSMFFNYGRTNFLGGANTAWTIQTPAAAALTGTFQIPMVVPIPHIQLQRALDYSSVADLVSRWEDFHPAIIGGPGIPLPTDQVMTFWLNWLIRANTQQEALALGQAQVIRNHVFFRRYADVYYALVTPATWNVGPVYIRESVVFFFSCLAYGRAIAIVQRLSDNLIF